MAAFSGIVLDPWKYTESGIFFNIRYIIGAMGLTLPVAVPFAVFGGREAAEALVSLDMEVHSSKQTSDADSTLQRPISAWKTWIQIDPNLPPSPSYKVPPTPSALMKPW